MNDCQKTPKLHCTSHLIGRPLSAACFAKSLQTAMGQTRLIKDSVLDQHTYSIMQCSALLNNLEQVIRLNP